MIKVFTVAIAILLMGGLTISADDNAAGNDGKPEKGERGKKDGMKAKKRAEIREKVKDMTEEERKAFFQQMKEQREADGKEGKRGKCKKKKGEKPTPA